MELPHLRSLLFAPGSDERKLAKALSSAADARRLRPRGRRRARRQGGRARVVAGALAGAGGPARLVRVNAAGTPWFEDDLALRSPLALDGLVLPKASPDAVDGARARRARRWSRSSRPRWGCGRRSRSPRSRAWPRCSSARSTSAPRSASRRGPTGQEILYARSKVAIDSAAAGLRGPFDVVHLDFGDEAGLEEQCRLARALGFRGKACIHPAQSARSTASSRPATTRSHGRAGSWRRSRGRARACSPSTGRWSTGRSSSGRGASSGGGP